MMNKVVYLCLAFVLVLFSACYAQTEKRIAIMDLSSAQNINNWWSAYSWGSSFEPGKSISAALTSKLVNSPKYMVLDRENLDLIMREQGLGQSGAVSPETAVEIGKLLGVRYIITGMVTEFDLVNTGGSGGVRVPISGYRLGLGGKGSDRVRVSCEIKVTDVETGMITSALSSRKEIATGSAGLAGFYKGYEFSGKGGELPSSGLGKGIYEVASDLAAQLETAQFKEIAVKPKLEGYVIDSEGDKVFINLTQKDGLVKNTVFKVMRSKQVKDPRTGKITNLDRTVTEIKVISVGESSSECQIMGSTGEAVQANDTVRQK